MDNDDKVLNLKDLPTSAEANGIAFGQILSGGDESEEEDYEMFSDYDSESEGEFEPSEDDNQGEHVDFTHNDSAVLNTLTRQRVWYGKNRTKFPKGAPSFSLQTTSSMYSNLALILFFVVKTFPSSLINN